MKLSRLLIGGFLIVAFMCGIIGFVAIDTFNKVGKINAELQEDFVSNTIQMVEMQKKAYKVYAKGMEYIILRKYKEKAAEIKAELKVTMGELKELGDKHFEYARYRGMEKKKNCQQILDKTATFNYTINGIIDFIDVQVKDTEEINKKIAEIQAKTVNSAHRTLADHLKEHKIEHMQELKDANISVIEAHISSRNTIIITTFVIIIFALIIGLAVSRSVTRPINELKENARKLGKGNLDTKIKIKSKNEIGELAASFNLMADDLKLLSESERKKSKALEKLTGELEIKVEERTKKLEEKSKTLEESRQSLALLLEDVNESRDELKNRVSEVEQLNSAMVNMMEDLRINNESLKTTTHQLANTNKELEAFSYSVSHDLRAPLRSVDGFSQILLEDYSDTLDEKGKHYLERARAGTQKMGQLIDDILNLSRIGRQAMKMKKINMKSIAGEVYNSLEDEWKGRKVDFNVHKCPPAVADLNLIKIVFINLLSNALKFTGNRKEAKIEVGSETKDEQTVFFVKDNGVGFDMKYAGKLFTPFQRLHRVEEYEGTGIGLAIVQRIIHRHGGRIWAESKVGKGTTFYFTLTA